MTLASNSNATTSGAASPNGGATAVSASAQVPTVQGSAVPPGKHAAQPTVGQLVSEASTHFSNLLHSEIELAKLELKASVKNAGTGVGFFGAAAVVLVFSLTFGFIALAEGLVALGLSRWLAFLVVFGAQLLFVILAALLGVRKVKRVKGPKRTIETSKDTVAYLQSNIKVR